jgi:hypothetical protein
LGNKGRCLVGFGRAWLAELRGGSAQLGQYVIVALLKRTKVAAGKAFEGV